MIEATEIQSNPEAGVDQPAEVRQTTQGGVALAITQACPEDKDILRDFFRHVSPEDLRFRFLETVKTVDEAVLQRMIAGGGDVTFLAYAMPGRALAAVATLTHGSGHGQADVAMATRSDWKKKGVSWTLLEHVLAFAKARGFATVSSLESADNRQAIALEREMGFIARLNSDGTAEVLASKTL
jgi:acetyltransferase